MWQLICNGIWLGLTNFAQISTSKLNFFFLNHSSEQLLLLTIGYIVLVLIVIHEQVPKASIILKNSKNVTI